MPRKLQRVKSGDAITAEWANAVVDAVNIVLNMSVGPGMSMSVGQHGVHIDTGVASLKGWRIGVTDGAVSPGGSVTVSRWEGDGGSESDSGEN